MVSISCIRCALRMLKKELVVVDGLADVLESSKLDGFDRCLHVVESGDHDDVGLRIDLSDFLQHLDTVKTGEVDVQDDQVGRDLLEQTHSLVPVRGHVDIESLAREMSLECLPDQAVVIDD